MGSLKSSVKHFNSVKEVYFYGVVREELWGAGDN